MDITKCHLCLLQPSHRTINTRWHFIVSLLCHERILLLQVCALLDVGCHHQQLKERPAELGSGRWRVPFFAGMHLPGVDRHVATWTRYRALVYQTKPRDGFSLKSRLIGNEAGGFTLRCKESCHRSISWAAGWAWWSSGNRQSSSSWRWCQAARWAQPCCCWELTVSWCCCIWGGCLSTSGQRWCQFDTPKRHNSRC